MDHMITIVADFYRECPVLYCTVFAGITILIVVVINRNNIIDIGDSEKYNP